MNWLDLDPETTYDTVEAAEAGLSKRYPVGAERTVRPGTDPTVCSIWIAAMLGRLAHLPNSPEKS